MRCNSVLLLVLFAGSAFAVPTEVTKDKCKDGKDPLACLKYKALNFMNEAARKDSIELMEGLKLVKTKESRERAERNLSEGVEDILDTHDLEVDVAGAKVTVKPNDEESKVTVTFDTSAVAEGRGKKHKLKKLLMPLMAFVLLKAMTLIPLALGILGIKAWNALQLSFFSFVTSLALAIFNLCKKVASDQTVPVAHAIAEPYHYAARNLILPQAEDAQELAYSAYEPQMNTQ